MNGNSFMLQHHDCFESTKELWFGDVPVRAVGHARKGREGEKVTRLPTLEGVDGP